MTLLAGLRVGAVFSRPDMGPELIGHAIFLVLCAAGCFWLAWRVSTHGASKSVKVSSGRPGFTRPVQDGLGASGERGLGADSGDGLSSGDPELIGELHTG
jgi:hypothetical protein